ncbi:MAG: hypothetical protein QOG97_1878, partial [Acidimicrobiaceae bacterium]|nr:hypothetical protein [Acidimicrobiaceae bacterium]
MVGAGVDLLWNEISLDHEAMDDRAVLDACDTLTGPGRWMPRSWMGGFALRSPTRSSPTGSDGTSRAATCPPEPPWNVPGPGVLARGTHHQAMRSDERIAGYWWLSSVRFVLEEREELIDAAE